ncbi:hypothetical protein [Desulfitobacterium sp.]|uniref:hypothetical protein n=1 Tax=Desulfitobacterium sp. TaxID=49981 RepID=UPI002CDE3DB3|nr:hypothetical protein [Desulfitobacterium sp.]HVJ48591.1 hypothetical protein [Desulfitobacterium sp.]
MLLQNSLLDVLALLEIQDAKVLVAQHPKYDRFVGKWELPGGEIEHSLLFKNYGFPGWSFRDTLILDSEHLFKDRIVFKKVFS